MLFQEIKGTQKRTSTSVAHQGVFCLIKTKYFNSYSKGNLI